MQNTYRYPALFEACEEGGYTVTFPDLPGIVTEGDDVDESIAMAKEALALHILGMERDGDDFLFIEDHCPICAAATACQGFCAAELAQFQALMQGWAHITREEHLLQGARRCVYRLQAMSVAV